MPKWILKYHSNPIILLWSCKTNLSNLRKSVQAFDSLYVVSADSPTLQKNTEVTDLAFQRGSRGNLCLTTFTLHHSFFPSITLDGSEGPEHDGVYNENTEADNKRTFNYSLRKSKIWWLVREWSFKWNHRFMLEISQLYSAIKGCVCVCSHIQETDFEGKCNSGVSQH